MDTIHTIITIIASVYFALNLIIAGAVVRKSKQATITKVKIFAQLFLAGVPIVFKEIVKTLNK